MGGLFKIKNKKKKKSRMVYILVNEFHCSGKEVGLKFIYRKTLCTPSLLYMAAVFAWERIYRRYCFFRKHDWRSLKNRAVVRARGNDFTGITVCSFNTGSP